MLNLHSECSVSLLNKGNFGLRLSNPEIILKGIRSRMNLKLGIVLFFAVMLYCISLSPDILGFYHDDGVYTVTAKALAEGKGYRIISLPGSPIQTLYPFFYPVVLSLAWRIFPSFPGNIVALKIPSIIFVLLFLFITYLYLVRQKHTSSRMALAVVMMTAFNPLMVWSATMTMSEALYCLTSVLSLWTVEIFTSNNKGYKRLFYLLAAGMAVAVSFMTRSAGVSLIGAMLTFAFLSKRELKQRLLSVVQLGLVIVSFLSQWIIWNIIQHVRQTYTEIYPYCPPFASNYANYAISHHGFNLLSIFKILLSNIYKCFLGSIPHFLLPYLDIREVLSPYFFKDYLLLCGIAFLSFGLSFLLIFSLVKTLLEKKIHSFTIYILFIFTMILFWPVESERRLLPVLPFIYILFLRGFSLFAKKLEYFSRILISKINTTATDSSWHCQLFSMLPRLILISFVILNCSFSLMRNRENIIIAKNYSEWEEKKNLFRWIRKNTNSNVILAGALSPVLYLYTERSSIPSILGFDVDDKIGLTDEMVTKNLKNLLHCVGHTPLYLIKISYIWPPTFEQMIDRLALKYPDRVSLTYESKDKRYAIYKVENLSDTPKEVNSASIILP